jgi:hypothetical protein
MKCCFLKLCFNDEIVEKWDINVSEFLKTMATNPNWFSVFCASVHHKVITEWLCRVLGIIDVSFVPSGVEVWFKTGEAEETCGVTFSKDGGLLVWPLDASSQKKASVKISNTLLSGNLVFSLRIREESSGTWGGGLHAELKENFIWRSNVLDVLLKTITGKSLLCWGRKKRAEDDPDSYVMNLILLQDVLKFLNKHPKQLDKQDLMLWKRFVMEVWGKENDLLVAFCPRNRLLFGANIRSDRFNALSPRRSDQVEKLKTILEAAIELLNKPRLTASILFSTLDISAACGAESVITTLAGIGKEVPTEFYVHSEKRESIEQYAHANNYDLQKSKTRMKVTLVRGSHADIETWILDYRIKLYFVASACGVLEEAFPNFIEHDNQKYRCQPNGRVFTHAIALLIRSLQQQNLSFADDVRKAIRRFFKERRMSFPVVANQRRKKKKLFFCDYNKEFYFSSDGTTITPEECVPILYTREMHENRGLDIW